MLAVVLLITLTCPTFAWYSQKGFLQTQINHNITAQTKSTFSLTYALREMETAEKILVGSVPNTNYGETAVEGDANFYNEGSWYKVNGAGAESLTSLLNLNESEITTAVVLSGQIGFGVTGEGDDAEQIIPADPLEPSDNKVPASLNANVKLMADDYDKADGESDNPFSFIGNFSAEEDKLCGVTVEISPLEGETAFEQTANQVAAEAVRYAVFSEQLTNADGTEIANPSKTIFANNAFRFAYGSEENLTESTAVSQNGYFLAKRGCAYRVTAVVWLDGLANPIAENGAFNVNVKVKDFSNIITNQLDVDLENNQIEGFLPNSAPVSELEIPSAFYMTKMENGVEKSVEVKITKICALAFENNQTLEKVIVPDTVEIIESSAFLNCSALEEVSLGNGLTQIGANAFTGCLNLTNLVLANPYGWNQTPTVELLKSGIELTK